MWKVATMVERWDAKWVVEKVVQLVEHSGSYLVGLWGEKKVDCLVLQLVAWTEEKMVEHWALMSADQTVVWSVERWVLNSVGWLAWMMVGNLAGWLVVAMGWKKAASWGDTMAVKMDSRKAALMVPKLVARKAALKVYCWAVSLGA